MAAVVPTGAVAVALAAALGAAKRLAWTGAANMGRLAGGTSAAAGSRFSSAGKGWGWLGAGEWFGAGPAVGGLASEGGVKPPARDGAPRRSIWRMGISRQVNIIAGNRSDPSENIFFRPYNSEHLLLFFPKMYLRLYLGGFRPLKSNGQIFARQQQTAMASKGGIGGFLKAKAAKMAAKTEEELLAQASIGPDDVLALEKPCESAYRFFFCGGPNFASGR